MFDNNSHVHTYIRILPQHSLTKLHVLPTHQFIVRMDQIRTLNISVDVGVAVGDVNVEMAVGQNLWIKF